MIPSTESYPAENNWARRQALGLDSPPPAFSVPAIKILQRLAGDSEATQESSAARSHKLVDQILAPPSQPPSYDAAKSAILGLCAPHPDQGDEDRNASMAINLEALRFFATLEQFLERKRVASRAVLESRHSEVYQRCRELSDRAAELQQLHGFAATTLMNLDHIRVTRESECAAIRSRKPTRYPSVEELVEWQEALDLAEGKLAAAVRDHRDGEAALEQTDFELQTAQRELPTLEREEVELRQKSGGK